MFRENSISFETLREVFERFPPPPFVGFTMHPAGYYRMRSEVRNRPAEKTEFSPFQGDFPGLEVVLVKNQPELILKWTDQKEMDAYVKEMRDKLPQDEVEQTDG